MSKSIVNCNYIVFYHVQAQKMVYNEGYNK